MKKLSITLCVALAATFSTASLAQDAAGQGAPAEAAAAGAAPGQVAGAAGGASGGGGPGAVFNTSLTYKSYSIAANGSEGNLEGAACVAPAKMISGACHPFYNPNVVIINQFPNIPGNTWRCGFKNNTAATVSVYIYTLCAQ